VKLINGLGQELTFGGQVMKNVAGYDVSRLMVGARGTLGLLTEASLKVLPLAPAEATLCFEMDQAAALEHLHRWGGQPLPLNASCWVLDDSVPGRSAKPSLYVRLRGAVAAVEAACHKMLAEAPGQRMDAELTRPDWALCRDQQLPFFAQRPGDAWLWRISLPQTAPPLALPYSTLVEWHGAQRWCWAPAGAAAELKRAATDAGGHAAPFWSDAAAPGANPKALQPQDAALALISQRLRASFDPAGIFNPGLCTDANPSRT
jgi:glycolate oxidase FAD binding subunit